MNNEIKKKVEQFGELYEKMCEFDVKEIEKALIEAQEEHEKSDYEDEKLDDYCNRLFVMLETLRSIKS